MAVTDCGNLSIIFEPVEFEICEIEAPDIVQPVILIFSAKHVNGSVVCSHSTAIPRLGYILVRKYKPGFGI